MSVDQKEQAKERPILFSGPMVRAILEGRKTQTRRIVKPQPPVPINELHGGELSKRAPYDIEDDEQRVCGWGFQDDCDGFYKFPYGKIGDRLWVRERWRPVIDDQSFVCIQYSDESLRLQLNDNDGEGDPVGTREHKQPTQKVHKYQPRWRPSIHMPRWASRITLEITGVRVERLQDITNSDCRAEGIEAIGEPRTLTSGHEAQAGRLDSRYSTVRQLFSELWQLINGPDSWDANPYVWAIEFKRA